MIAYHSDPLFADLQGVQTGYTRLGNKPCLNPLLAVLEEAKLVVGFWLQADNASCASNLIAFTLDLRANLPWHLRLRLVRADSGFCVAEWLDLLEQQKLHYIVVARLLKPLQRLVKNDLLWAPSEVPGTGRITARNWPLCSTNTLIGSGREPGEG